MTDRPRCTATKRNGEPCMGFALPGKTTCLAHSITPEERHERAVRGGRARGVQSRAKRSHASALDAFRSGLTPRDFLKALAPMLSATFADGHPDWVSRSLAMIALSHAFAQELRSTPEQVRASLETAMPEAVRQTAERLDAERTYVEMRRALINSRIRMDTFGQLYVAPLPPWAFADWEDAEEVMRKEAPDLSNVTPIKATDGTVLIERGDGFVTRVEVDAA